MKVKMTSQEKAEAKHAKKVLNDLIRRARRRGALVTEGLIQKMVISFILVFSFITATVAQRATVTKEGNYVQIKNSNNTTEGAKETGKTFTDTKGNVYPVLVSKNGKEFYMRTSKAGNVYRAYIKVN